MERVAVERTIAADPEAVRAAMADRRAFMLAAAFDDVTVDGDRMVIENAVGPFSIELVLDVCESDAAFAYEQVEGIFEAMRTEYRLDPADDGTRIVAETTFAVADLPVLGRVLDSTLIERQRRAELTAQLDWLEDRAA